MYGIMIIIIIERITSNLLSYFCSFSCLVLYLKKENFIENVYIVLSYLIKSMVFFVVF